MKLSDVKLTKKRIQWLLRPERIHLTQYAKDLLREKTKKVYSGGYVKPLRQDLNDYYRVSLTASTHHPRISKSDY